MIDIIRKTISIKRIDGKDAIFKIKPFKVYEYLEANEMLFYFDEYGEDLKTLVPYVLFILFEIHYPNQIDELNFLTTEQVKKLISYLSGFGYELNEKTNEKIASMLSISQIKITDMLKMLGLSFSEVKNLTTHQLSQKIDLVNEIKREIKKNQQNEEAKQRMKLFN